MTEFDDFTKRIKSHLKERERKQEHKEKKFYIVIACMGIAFTIIEIYQNVI